MVTPEMLRQLPTRPGVYIMYNADNKVIYVGKAINLRHRVRSYFQASARLDLRKRQMVEQIDHFEIIATRTDLEALALESNLIKEHRPKYNIKLRDDKQYPWLKIAVDEPYPRVQVVRRPVKDGSRYFGPFTDSGAMWETVRLLKRVFPLRTCKKRLGREAVDRPCLNWHIGRCLGPCQGKVTPEAYKEVVDQVTLFLSGRSRVLLDDLEKRMTEAAQNMEFERAAHLRDQIKDIRRVVERQRVVSARGEDQDVLSYALGKTFAMVQVLKVREGKLVGREHFEVDQGISDGADELLTSFILQFYDERTEIPGEILLPIEVSEQETLLGLLKEQAGHAIRFTVPNQGPKKHLVEMAMENAQTLLAQEENKREWKAEQYNAALEDLAKALGLKSPPRRIEAFDISNTQGNQSVASMAVIIEGQPKGSEYRRFRIKTVEGPNDFASLQEAVGRRFRRGLAERAEGKGREGKFATFPDLLLIDGGKGQLHAVCEVLKELGLENQPIIGLAKENEEIFVPTSNQPIILPRESPALHMLQRVRDEAHRFAITYHRSLRDKRTVASSLDEIPGIGPKRKQALLRHFGSVARIRRATLEELMQVEGMTEAAARAVAEGLSE